MVAGCGDNVKHEFTVNPELRKAPIRSLIVLDPVVSRKVKRVRPDDFFHMKPDRVAVTSQRVRDALIAGFSASLTVDTTFVPDEATRAWAAEIGDDLARGRVPLAVEPHPLAAEAVLLTGIQLFGWEHVEIQWQVLWFTRRSIGPPKVLHNAKIQVILVNPRTGEVLMDGLEGQEETTHEESEELLDRLARQVTDEIVGACPIPEGARPPAIAPGGAMPPPAASPSPLPPTSPSGTTP